MRTKTLLIAAAALAAGVITSQAQPVYSQNVVGYVNQVIPGNGAQSLIVNPLQNTTNGVEQILTGLQGGENILLWSGSGYYIYNFNPGLQANDGTPSDWIDLGGNIPGDVNDQGTLFAPPPQIAPGQGFFVVEGGNAFTNTWVGSVVLSSTNTLAGSGFQSLLGSQLPISGDLETNTTINLPLQGGENILVWAGNGYYIYNYNPGLKANDGTPSDWIDLGGNIPGDVNDQGTLFAPDPQISIGQAFFYVNGNGATNWVQNLVLQ